MRRRAASFAALCVASPLIGPVVAYLAAKRPFMAAVMVAFIVELAGLGSYTATHRAEIMAEAAHGQSQKLANTALTRVFVSICHPARPLCCRADARFCPKKARAHG